MDQMTIADLQGNFLMVGFQDREAISKIILAGGTAPADAKYAVYRAKDELMLVGGFDTLDECVAYAESFCLRVRMLFLNPMGQ